MLASSLLCQTIINEMTFITVSWIRRNASNKAGSLLLRLISTYDVLNKRWYIASIFTTAWLNILIIEMLWFVFSIQRALLNVYKKYLHIYLSFVLKKIPYVYMK